MSCSYFLLWIAFFGPTLQGNAVDKQLWSVLHVDVGLDML